MDADMKERVVVHPVVDETNRPNPANCGAIVRVLWRAAGPWPGFVLRISLSGKNCQPDGGRVAELQDGFSGTEPADDGAGHHGRQGGPGEGATFAV